MKTLLLLGALSCWLLGAASCEDAGKGNVPAPLFPSREGLQAEGGPAAAARSDRAKQLVESGRREGEIGAYFAAIAAYEGALVLDKDNAAAKEGIQRARRLLADASASLPAPETQGPPAATVGPASQPAPAAGVVVVPPGPVVPPSGVQPGPSGVVPGMPLNVPGPAAPGQGAPANGAGSQGPAVSPTQPAARGCLGDEQMVITPGVVASGDSVTVTVTSGRSHVDVRLATALTPDFLGGQEDGATFVWRWRIPAQQKGAFPVYYYVDHNVLCASSLLTVTGRWQPLALGLPAPPDFKVTAAVVSPAFPFDRTVFVAFDGHGVFKSADANSLAPTFAPAVQGLTNLSVLSLAISPDFGRDGTLFATTRKGGVFRSRDGGQKWEPAALPDAPQGDATAVVISPNFRTDGVVLIALDGAGIVGSRDGGMTWAPLNNGLKDLAVQSLAISADFGNDQAVFAAGRFSGAYKFTPGSTEGKGQLAPGKWGPLNDGLSNLWLRALAFSPFYGNDKTLLAAGVFGGLFRFDGNQWSPLKLGGDERAPWVRAIALSPGFAQDGTVYAGTLSGVYRTSDKGGTWVPLVTGLRRPPLKDDPEQGVRTIALSPNFNADRTVFAGIWGDGLYRVVD